MESYRLPARAFKALAHPIRLRILNALRHDEECVCHLTAVLRQRQAYVSQHLRLMRQAGIIVDRKEGLRVYYRVRDARVFDALDVVNGLVGAEKGLALRQSLAKCPCPKCESRAKGGRK